MNYWKEHQGQILLPSALFTHFDTLFASADDFAVWSFFLHDATLAPSEIAQKIGKALSDVNASIDRLQVYRVLKIDGNKEAIFDCQPLFERLSALTESENQTVSSDSSSDGILQQLVTAFEAEMGTVSPIQMEEIRSWLKEDSYDPALIYEALKEAALNRKVSINYIHAILRNWRQEGVRVLADVKDRRDEREAAQRPLGEESFYIPTEGPWHVK